MSSLVVPVAIGAAAVGGWFLLYTLILLATRPARPDPAPATQDLPGNTYVGPDRLAEQRGHPKVVGRSGAARDQAAARRLWELAAFPLDWFPAPHRADLEKRNRITGGDRVHMTRRLEDIFFMVCGGLG